MPTMEETAARVARETLAAKARMTRPTRPHPMSSLGRPAPARPMEAPKGRTEDRVPGRVLRTGPSRPQHPMSSLGSPRPDHSALMSCITPTSSSHSGAPATKPGVSPPGLTPWGNKRSDAPALNYTLRGDKKRGLQIASDPELLGAAMAKYQDEIRSSGDTSDAYVKTWQDFHEAVCWTKLGVAEPYSVLPLTPLKISVVGAILKASGYRATKNYLASIKRAHRLAGFAWDDQLDLAATSFTASTLRGLGPGRQSCPLPFEKLTSLPIDDLVQNPRFPVAPSFCIVLFTFYLLRELECATAEFVDMNLDREQRKARFTLSVSKSDPRALGCDRTWGCVCPDPDVPASRACPYHAAEALVDFLISRFGHRVREDGFPLFPDAAGKQVSADSMLDFIVELAVLCGEPLKSKSGQNRFGKHSWRATGAVFLGACGIEVWKITMLGRWHCSIVISYTRTAPLATVTDDFKRARSSSDSRGGNTKWSAPSQAKIRDVVAKATADLSREVQTLNEKLALVEARAIPSYVINRKTNRWHRILTSFAETGNDAVAFCGFAYARSTARCKFASCIPSSVDDENLCKSCLSDELAARVR